MKKIFYPDFFNDVFGPIMQPGSSGGFGGPIRMGNIAKALIREDVKKVVFLYQKDEEDFFKGIGNFYTDRGYLGGVQGFNTEDIRNFSAYELAKESELEYEFKLDDHNYGYKKGVKFEVYGENTKGEMIALSAGGGMVLVHEVNGYKLQWESDTYGLIVYNSEDSDVKKQIEDFTKKYESHIVDSSTIENKGKKASFIELDISIEDSQLKSQFTKSDYLLLPAVLPIVTTKSKGKQLFTTVEEWRQAAKERNISFLQAAIEYEKISSGWSDEKIWNYFKRIREIFYHQVHSLEERNYEAEDTPLLPVYGKKWKAYLEKNKTISDPLTAHILTHAYATNAKIPGVLLVPGPMGTGGGYLFSALDAVREERGYSIEKEVEGLVIAAALGAMAYTHTNASGERGCIGETGVCNAMAAGAIAWMTADENDPVTPDVAVERAASMALQANMGLVCDPIPGGLEFPCITRTFRAAVTAPMYAEMARIGIDPLIPYHECLIAMEKHYKETPSHMLSGANCGTCTTPTAERCKLFLQKVTQLNS